VSGPSKPNLNHLLSRLFDRNCVMRLNQSTGCKWNFKSVVGAELPLAYES
jgi:hypothetical protein